MIELRGATAVVTGGGSGIGRALVLGLAAEGCDVVVADIAADDAAGVARDATQQHGVRTVAVATDVADRSAMIELAERATAFGGGTVDVVCLNAGVLVWGSATESTEADWRWLLDVNVMGVVHGVGAFLDGLLAQATPAHLLVTASSAAIDPGAGLAAYSASKGAVLALTEALHAQLADTNVGVTALLPSSVESRILDAQRHRPSSSGPKAPEPMGTGRYGIDATHVADSAIAAIRAGELYAFTGPADSAEAVLHALTHRHEALTGAIVRGAVPPTQ